MRAQSAKAQGSGTNRSCRGSTRAFSVKKALSFLESSRIYGGRSGEISSVTCDSRKVVPGACFVAITGEGTDGHRYVSEAAISGAKLLVVERAVSVPESATVAVVRNSRKAAAVLADAFHGHPSHALDVVGITGTHGKTTTTYMLRHIMQFAGVSSGMLTTVKYDTGLQIMNASQTTPGPVRLNELLADAVQAGIEVMPMEVSSHALCQHRVTGVRFSGAAFTNLASDHLDYHKTREAYREAKSKLFEMLRPEAFCALNADDVNWEYYADRTSARTVTYSVREEADLQGRVRAADVSGVKLDLIHEGRRRPVNLGLLGIHNVENALAAAACALSLGVEETAVAEALNVFPGVAGRLQRIETGNGLAVFVDYAHTAGSLATVLSNVKPFSRGRLIVVFGAGGDRDRSKRPRMAQAVQRYADFSVLTSDNPRSEDPMEIIKEVQVGFGGSNSHLIEPDRQKAIEAALDRAVSGDVVVIAGKGHEDYQIFADRVEHFDDSEVVREILGNR